MRKFEIKGQKKAAIAKNTKSDAEVKGNSALSSKNHSSVWRGPLQKSCEFGVNVEFKFMSDDITESGCAAKAVAKRITFSDTKHMDVYKSKVVEWPGRVLGVAFSKNGSVPLSSRIREAKLFRFNGAKRIAFFEFKSEDFGVFHVECEVSKEVKDRLKKCKNQSARVVALI